MADTLIMNNTETATMQDFTIETRCGQCGLIAATPGIRANEDAAYEVADRLLAEHMAGHTVMVGGRPGVWTPDFNGGIFR